MRQDANIGGHVRAMRGIRVIAGILDDDRMGGPATSST
jgi:hypothetical protein